jgi:outer membrane murein-binding lipoprotein Lpp
MKIVELIFEFISEAWGLIYKLALVILAIVVIVAFIKGCAANATLNEHSSCQQFQQADTATQDKVLQDMMAAHHDQGSVSVTRFSVTLYCNVHDDNSPIDGIYNSSNAGQQSAQALHISAPLTALVYSSQAWSKAAA